MVQCYACHLSFDVSARTARDIRAGRVEARCKMHRKRRPRPAVANASHRRYWLDRWSLDTIREVGTAIWPDLRPGPPTVSGALMALADGLEANHRAILEDREPTAEELVVIERAAEARKRVRTLTAA